MQRTVFYTFIRIVSESMKNWAEASMKRIVIKPRYLCWSSCWYWWRCWRWWSLETLIITVSIVTSDMSSAVISCSRAPGVKSSCSGAAGVGHTLPGEGEDTGLTLECGAPRWWCCCNCCCWLIYKLGIRTTWLTSRTTNTLTMLKCVGWIPF